MMETKKGKRPWINEECFISPWVYKARQKMNLPKEVTIYDITLRDGEQYPGLVFRKEDKILLAKALDSLGIPRLEVGMPAVSQEDFDAAKEIVKQVKANCVVFSRAIRSDIDLALEVGAWGVIVEVPANEKLINDGYVWEKKDVVEKAIDTCNYAKTNGLHTTFFMIDSSGADPEFLKSLIQSVTSKADIDSITAVDTFGRLNPTGMKKLIQSMKKWAKVPVEVHVHNDFGLATANTLAAVEAGAEVVHTSMLGLGERSGGTPTEEIAVGLKFLYGLDPGLHFKKLMETGKIFQKVSGITMPGHKPVVGDNSFSYEAGVAAMFAYRLFEKNFPLGVMPYRAEEVGNEFKIVIGKKSGKYSVIWHLEKNEKNASEEQIERIVSKIKTESIGKKRGLSHEEFIKIVEEICKPG
jgi:isopropylmalate/homocitrate/citramalate synthase